MKHHSISAWAGPGVAALAVALAFTQSLPPIHAEEPPTTALEHANSLSRAFRHAAEKATPSVVVVRSESKPRDGGRAEGGNRGGRRGRASGARSAHRSTVKVASAAAGGKLPSAASTPRSSSRKASTASLVTAWATAGSR